MSACSLLSRTTYKSANDALPLIWFENIWGYFEVSDAIALSTFQGQSRHCSVSSVLHERVHFLQVNPVATIPMNRTGIQYTFHPNHVAHCSNNHTCAAQLNACELIT